MQGSRNLTVALPGWMSDHAAEISQSFQQVQSSIAEILDDDQSLVELSETMAFGFRAALLLPVAASVEMKTKQNALLNIMIGTPKDLNYDINIVGNIRDNPELSDRILENIFNIMAMAYRNSFDTGLYNPEYDQVVILYHRMASLLCEACALRPNFERDRYFDALGQAMNVLQEFACRLAADGFSFVEEEEEEGEEDEEAGRAVIGHRAESDLARELDPYGELAGMIGLESVKVEVDGLIKIAKYNKVRERLGHKNHNMSYHLVFSGNPGTGKTTVARIIAKVYGDLGILSKGHLIEVDRSHFVGEYIGQTSIKTKSLIESALGGVLFIDEAYTLSSGGERDYGQEAIDILLKEMEDNRDDIVVIVAGYTDKIEEFIESNPGLRSRFSKTIAFPDYSPEEMVAIFERLASVGGYVLEAGARDILPGVMARLKANAGEKFGNARDVRKLFERTIERHSRRLDLDAPDIDREIVLIRIEDIASGLGN